MEPLIRKLMKKFKLSRRMSSIIVFIITFGVIVGLLSWGIVTLVSESTNLLSSLNDYYNKVYTLIQDLITKMDFIKIKIPDKLLDVINNSAVSLLQKISEFAQRILSNIITGITSIPTIVIYFAITILALYFICTDKIYMLDELEYHLPEKWMKELTKHIRQLITVLGGYLKAQLILILISFIICLIGLYILYFLGLNVGFPLIIALGIAFVDALPIVGSGAVMIPWGIISGLNGNLKLVLSVIRKFNNRTENVDDLFDSGNPIVDKFRDNDENNEYDFGEFTTQFDDGFFDGFDGNGRVTLQKAGFGTGLAIAGAGIFAAIAALAGIAISLALSPLKIMLDGFYWQLIRGNNMNFGDGLGFIFRKTFDKNYWAKFLLNLIQGLLLAILYFLFIIPGVIFYYKWYFTSYILALFLFSIEANLISDFGNLLFNSLINS